MVKFRCPLRVSFFGGGTDVASYFMRDGRVGAVLSSSIVVGKHLDTYVGEPGAERYANKGLAYSSAHTALRSVDKRCPSDYGRLTHDRESSAEQIIQQRVALATAYEEIIVQKKPIGFQDQIGVCLGGMKLVLFYKDGFGLMREDPYSIEEDPKTRWRAALQDRLIMFDLGPRPPQEGILSRHQENTERNAHVLSEMAAQAIRAAHALALSDISIVGPMLDRAWTLKRELDPGMESPRMKEFYAKAKLLGAVGGKCCGAGGGGAFILFIDGDTQQEIGRNRERMLNGLGRMGAEEIPFMFEDRGLHSVETTGGRHAEQDGPDG